MKPAFVLILSVVVITLGVSERIFACDNEAEAQIHAKVAETSFSLSEGCRIRLKDYKIQTNSVCPNISPEDIQQYGIISDVINGHECKAQVDDDFNAVVVKNGNRLVVD